MITKSSSEIKIIIVKNISERNRRPEHDKYCTFKKYSQRKRRCLKKYSESGKKRKHNKKIRSNSKSSVNKQMRNPRSEFSEPIVNTRAAYDRRFIVREK